jgi:hypothetical protein
MQGREGLAWNEPAAPPRRGFVLRQCAKPSIGDDRKPRLGLIASMANGRLRPNQRCGCAEPRQLRHAHSRRSDRFHGPAPGDPVRRFRKRVRARSSAWSTAAFAATGVLDRLWRGLAIGAVWSALSRLYSAAATSVRSADGPSALRIATYRGVDRSLALVRARSPVAADPLMRGCGRDCWRFGQASADFDATGTGDLGRGCGAGEPA